MPGHGFVAGFDAHRLIHNGAPLLTMVRNPFLTTLCSRANHQKVPWKRGSEVHMVSFRRLLFHFAIVGGAERWLRLQKRCAR